jgi:hypothetical protein
MGQAQIIANPDGSYTCALFSLPLGNCDSYGSLGAYWNDVNPNLNPTLSFILSEGELWSIDANRQLNWVILYRGFFAVSYKGH